MDAPIVVRRWLDGKILDIIRPEELVGPKPLHEAACWAYIAIEKDRREEAASRPR